jgi:hypothetical protein
MRSEANMAANYRILPDEREVLPKRDPLGRVAVFYTVKALSLAPGFSRVESALVPENGFNRFLDGRTLESR